MDEAFKGNHDNMPDAGIGTKRIHLQKTESKSSYEIRYQIPD